MSNSAHLQAAKLFSQVNRVALVTGGGTGIGLMCAQALAANGAKVYIGGRRMEAVQQAAKIHGTKDALGNSQGSLVPIQLDVTDKSSIAKAVEEIKQNEKGVLHYLVNNAGISSPTRSVEHGDSDADKLADELNQDTFEDWDTTLRTNVTGAFFTSVGFLPLLATATKQTPGFSAGIVNITSISGMTKASQHHFAYNVSKGAAIHLNEIMAKEFARSSVKVRVNSLAPGIFPSEMTTGESDDKQKSHIDAQGYRDEKGIPAGRPGKDEDMAQALLLLLSNQYINGVNINVDGGYLLTLPS